MYEIILFDSLGKFSKNALKKVHFNTFFAPCKVQIAIDWTSLINYQSLILYSIIETFSFTNHF